MGNKLGPALVIALGIFAIYLVLTGKATSLVAAANSGNNSDTANGKTGTGAGAPASAPDPSYSSFGSYDAASPVRKSPVTGSPVTGSPPAVGSTAMTDNLGGVAGNETGNLQSRLSGYQPNMPDAWNMAISAQITTLLDRIGVGGSSRSGPQTMGANVGNVGAISDGWTGPPIEGGYANPQLAKLILTPGAPLALLPGSVA